jgi:transmembrane sensor
LETHKIIAQLIYKSLSGSLNDEESQALQDWLGHSERNRKLFTRLTSETYLEKTAKINLEEQWRKVVQADPARVRRARGILSIRTLSKSTRYKLVAAAAFIGLVVGGYVWYKAVQNRNVQLAARINSPNGNIRNPLLLLASGSIIELDPSVTGPVARINGHEIRNRNRQVKFDPVPISHFFVYNKYVYPDWLYLGTNKIITPKGCNYVVALGDGSEVVLNENSMLKFPSQFGRDQRVVEVSGEAHFKVKPHKAGSTGQKIPFIVSVNNMTVEVVGTEFNIRANTKDGSVWTTLEEGTVKVKKDSMSFTLRAGQAIVLKKEGQFTEPKYVNVDERKAWKVMAEFDNAPIEDIMEHISRNFPINVIYTSKMPHRLTVYIPATTSLVEALKPVEMTETVDFKIEGKNVYVIPKLRF